MKKIFLLFMLITIIFSACSEIDLSQVSDEDLERVSDKLIVCEKPYIRVGTECCLDENDNGICDEDDRKKDKLSENNNNKDKDKERDNDKYDTDEITFEEIESDEESKVDVKAYLDDEYVVLTWNPQIDVKDFKYYKVMHSVDNKNLKYPNDKTLKVIDNYEDMEFKIKNGFKAGINYYRISVVLSNDEVIHSNVISAFYEDDHDNYNEDEEIEIKVKIYSDGSEIEIEINDYEEEFKLELNDIIEIKKWISEKFDLDYNLVVDIIEIDYKDDYLFEDENETDETETDEDKVEDEIETYTIALGDYESTSVKIYETTYNISPVEILELSAIIEVNGVEKELYEGTGDYFGEIYVNLDDLIYSTRTSIKSYIELTLSNSVIDGEFYCSIGSKKTIGYEYLDSENIITKSNYCDGDNLIYYTCSDNEKTIDWNEKSCDYGCNNGVCGICYIEDEDKLPNPQSIGEGESISTTIDDYEVEVEVLSISDNEVLITINGETASVDICDYEEVAGLIVQLNEIVTSDRDSVKGYIDISFILEEDGFEYGVPGYVEGNENPGESSSKDVSCTDSDGGSKFTKQGTTTGYGNIGSIYEDEYKSYTDKCWNTDGLTEYTCDGNDRVQWQHAECSFWLGVDSATCSQGVCIAFNEKSDLDIFSECFGEDTTINTSCTFADYDGNNAINFADLGLFKAGVTPFDLDGDSMIIQYTDIEIEFTNCWQKYTNENPECEAADFDNSGFVNTIDLGNISGALSNFDFNEDGIVDFRD